PRSRYVPAAPRRCCLGGPRRDLLRGAQRVVSGVLPRCPSDAPPRSWRGLSTPPRRERVGGLEGPGAPVAAPARGRYARQRFTGLLGLARPSRSRIGPVGSG